MNHFGVSHFVVGHFGYELFWCRLFWISTILETAILDINHYKLTDILVKHYMNCTWQKVWYWYLSTRTRTYLTWW